MADYTIFPIKRSPKIKLSNYKWHYFIARESSISRDEAWINWLMNHGLKALVMVPKQKDVFDYYVDDASFQHALDIYRNRLAKNWPRHLRDYDQAKKNLIKSAWNLSRSCKSQNNKLILRKYREYLKVSYSFNDYIWGAWSVIYCLEPELSKIYPNDMEIITAVDKPIDYVNMERALFRLKPDGVVKKYGWLKMYSLYDRPFTVADIKKLKAKKTKQEVNRQFASLVSNKARYQKFIAKIRDKKLRKTVEMTHAYAWLKTDRIDAWRQSMQALVEFFQYLAKFDKTWSLKQVANLTYGEIVYLLVNKKLSDNRVLAARGSGQSLYYFHNHQILESINIPEIKRIAGILEGRRQDSKIIKGTSACQGKAVGTVKIISHSSELSKIKPGDIFVANFTFPTYTPAMIKSSAIVTNEGGLTTHAAIISREYKIPCIVGTKIATKVLKDGDLVEVDANRGIIKKIK